MFFGFFLISILASALKNTSPPADLQLLVSKYIEELVCFSNLFQKLKTISKPLQTGTNLLENKSQNTLQSLIDKLKLNLMRYCIVILIFFFLLIKYENLSIVLLVSLSILLSDCLNSLKDLVTLWNDWQKISNELQKDCLLHNVKEANESLEEMKEIHIDFDQVINPVGKVLYEKMKFKIKYHNGKILFNFYDKESNKYYSYELPKKNNRIVLGLLGPSGGGKSSLFNMMNFYSDRFYSIDKEICMNNIPINKLINYSDMSIVLLQKSRFFEISSIQAFLSYMKVTKNDLSEHQEFLSKFQLPKIENNTMLEGIGFSGGESKRFNLFIYLLYMKELLERQRQNECTKGLVILMDEFFGPLDPNSRNTVFKELELFLNNYDYNVFLLNITHNEEDIYNMNDISAIITQNPEGINYMKYYTHINDHGKEKIINLTKVSKEISDL